MAARAVAARRDPVPESLTVGSTSATAPGFRPLLTVAPRSAAARSAEQLGTLRGQRDQAACFEHVDKERVGGTALAGAAGRGVGDDPGGQVDGEVRPPVAISPTPGTSSAGRPTSKQLR
jgi:hypothetical protein